MKNIEENRLKDMNEKNGGIISAITTAIITAAMGVFTVIIGNLLGYLNKWWTYGFFVWIVVWTIVLIAGMLLWLNCENFRKFVALLVFFSLGTIGLVFVALWCNDKEQGPTTGDISPTATINPSPAVPQEPSLTPTSSPTPTVATTLTPTPTLHVHDYSWRVKTTKEANCTSEGKKEHGCVCGDYWTETIPMQEHSLVTDKEIAATCVTTGKTEGSHCSICKYVKVEQKIIPMTDHKYKDDSDAYCDYCNAYRATWHYYDQWNNSVYGDWELYNTESEEKVKEKSVTTYTYVVYYWVDPTRIGNERYRATGSRLLPANYTFNKYLTGKESSNYAGITTGTDTYITMDTNKKYNIRQSEIFYSPQTDRFEAPWIINGIEYWEEILGSEKQEEKYTEYHYFFRKFY